MSDIQIFIFIIVPVTALLAGWVALLVQRRANKQVEKYLKDINIE